jgi:hypothetical protein
VSNFIFAPISQTSASSGSAYRVPDVRLVTARPAVRIAEAPGHLPIGLLADAVVRRRIPAGAMLAMDDVEMRDDSLAHRAWRDIEADCLAASAVFSSTRAAAAG